MAEGRKQATILASEAEKAEQINRAAGEAEAILLRAEASAKGIEKVAMAIARSHGKDAVSMAVAEKYVEAFGKMAKEGTTMIVPAAANDAASMVAQVIISFSLTVTIVKETKTMQTFRPCPSTRRSTSQILLVRNPRKLKPRSTMSRMK